MTAILEREGIVDEEQDRDPWGEQTLHGFVSTSVIDIHRIPHSRCHSHASRIPQTFSIIDASDEESARFGRENEIQRFQTRQEGRSGGPAAEPRSFIADARTAFNRQDRSETHLDSTTDVTKGGDSYEDIISD